jgi:predicted membrane chloride channel (bestrophin family)
MIADLSNVQVSLERILSTPMLPIYSIHLKMVLTLYFAFLPFQFLAWSYALVPLTAVRVGVCDVGVRGDGAGAGESVWV